MAAFQLNLSFCPFCFPILLQICPESSPVDFLHADPLWVYFQPEPRKSEVNFEDRISEIYEQSREEWIWGQNKKKIEESVISPRFLTSMSRRMCLLLSLERPKIISRVLNMFCFRRLHDLPAQAGNVKYVVNTWVVSFLRSPLQPPLSWPSSLTWSSVVARNLASKL